MPGLTITLSVANLHLNNEGLWSGSWEDLGVYPGSEIEYIEYRSSNFILQTQSKVVNCTPDNPTHYISELSENKIVISTDHYQCSLYISYKPTDFLLGNVDSEIKAQSAGNTLNHTVDAFIRLPSAPGNVKHTTDTNVKITQGDGLRAHSTDARLGRKECADTTWNFLNDTQGYYHENPSSCNMFWVATGSNTYSPGSLRTTTTIPGKYTCTWKWTGKWSDLNILPNTPVGAISLSNLSFRVPNQNIGSIVSIGPILILDSAGTERVRIANEIVTSYGNQSSGTAGQATNWVSLCEYSDESVDFDHEHNTGVGFAANSACLISKIPTDISDPNTYITLSIVHTLDSGSISPSNIVLDIDDFTITICSTNNSPSTTGVGADLGLSWNDTTIAGSSLETKWNDGGLAGSSRSLTWNTNATVNIDLAVKFNTTTAVGKNLGIIFNDSALAGRSVELKWTDYNLSSRSLATSWKVLKLVRRDSGLLWNIRAKISKDLSIKWNSTRTIRRDLKLKYGVKTKTKYVARNLDLLESVTESINTLLNRRGIPGGGYNCHRTVELYGGQIIEFYDFEPDPATFRNDYYYNTVSNMAYRRVYQRYEPQNGVIIASWQPMS